jgi:hypothetical protein
MKNMMNLILRPRQIYQVKFGVKITNKDKLKQKLDLLSYYVIILILITNTFLFNLSQNKFIFCKPHFGAYFFKTKHLMHNIYDELKTSMMNVKFILKL